MGGDTPLTAAADYGRRAALRTVGSWNPIAGSPAAALDTEAMLAAFGPSLMPRASLHQGVAAGLAVLAGRGVSAVAELAGDPLALSAVRSGGTLIAAGALSGLAYDLAMAARDRIPGPAGARIVVVSLAGVGATLLVARRRLRVSEAAVEEWTPSDKPADLARSVLIARSTVSSPRWFVMRAPGRSAPARR